MEDFYSKFKGHFKIECFDKNNNLLDSYEDHNFIMKPARRTIAEMFSNKKNTGLNFLVLGTSGGTNTPFIPITENTGFSKERTHLYSESIESTVGQNLYLYKYETVKVTNLGTYRYIGESGNVTLSQEVLNSSQFENCPYNYTYYLKTKPINTPKEPNGISNYANNTNNSCILSIDTSADEKTNLENTSVDFEFIIGMSEANAQHNSLDEGYSSNCSLINEAGLYINNRLFCSKCFSAKVKDEATKMKITWKIIF